MLWPADLHAGWSTGCRSACSLHRWRCPALAPAAREQALNSHPLALHLAPCPLLDLQVRRWDVETGKVLQEAQLHDKQISDMQVRFWGGGRWRTGARSAL